MVSPEGWTVCTVENYITGGTESLIVCVMLYTVVYVTPAVLAWVMVVPVERETVLC